MLFGHAASGHTIFVFNWVVSQNKDPSIVAVPLNTNEEQFLSVDTDRPSQPGASNNVIDPLFSHDHLNEVLLMFWQIVAGVLFQSMLMLSVA